MWLAQRIASCVNPLLCLSKHLDGEAAHFQPRYPPATVQALASLAVSLLVQEPRCRIHPIQDLGYDRPLELIRRPLPIHRRSVSLNR